MKKFLCIALCLICVCSFFVGCGSNPTPTDSPDTTDNVPKLAYNGLHTVGVTAAALASAAEVEEASVIVTTTGSGEELLLINDVLYNTILYKQLQCINYADKTVVTLTYILSDETLEDSMSGIIASLDEQFGAPTSTAQSNSGSVTYTWRDGSNSENYLILYPLSDTELKLSFYLF